MSQVLDRIPRVVEHLELWLLKFGGSDTILTRTVGLGDRRGCIVFHFHFSRLLAGHIRNIDNHIRA